MAFPATKELIIKEEATTPTQVENLAEDFQKMSMDDKQNLSKSTKTIPLESTSHCSPKYKELHAYQLPLDQSIDLSNLGMTKKVLGSGSYGNVFEGVCDGKQVAVKIFNFFGTTEDNKKEIENIR